MKRMQLKITDLNYDVLKHVMYYVAISSDGAKNLARVVSVWVLLISESDWESYGISLPTEYTTGFVYSCRLFKEVAKDTDILKAVTFDDIKLSAIHGSFWRPSGLLCTCVANANQSASDKVTDVCDPQDRILLISWTGSSLISLSLVRFTFFNCLVASGFGFFYIMFNMRVQYAEMLNATHKVLKRDMFRAKMV